MTYSLQYRFGTGTNQDKAFLQQLQIDLDGIITGLNTIGSVTEAPSIVALASLTPAADKVPYFTGATTAATADFTAAARAFVAAATVAAQQAALGQGLVLLQTQVGAGASTPVLDFVNGVGGTVLDDTYDRYRLVIDTLRPATDDVTLNIQTGTGGGPTYATTNYSTQMTIQDTGVIIFIDTTNNTGVQLGRASAGNSIGNAAAENISAVIEFANPESTTQDCIFHLLGGGYINPSGVLIALVGGAARHNTPAAITGIRVTFETGDITSGRVSLYAYRK